MSIKILIVEDNVEFREMLQAYIRTFLKLHPAQVDSTSSGNKAIRLLRSGLSYNLIISDYLMADGNGIDLLNFLIRHSPNVPIVFCTSYEEFRPPRPIAFPVLACVEKNDLKGLMEQVYQALKLEK